MANTLTNLIPTIYDACDTVSRELVGMIPSVYVNSNGKQAAVDQSITYPVVGANTAADVAPGLTGPDPADRITGNAEMKITKSRGVSFYRTGEETLGLGANGKPIIQMEFEQAFRTLTNEVEADLASLRVHASRAYGTAGATPFGTAGDFSDAAHVAKILKDNGSPNSDLQLVINTAAGANILGKQSQTHMAGSDDPLRRGVILDINGLKIRESAAIESHIKGDGSGYLVNNAATAKGDTVIAADTGSGTVLSGDIITMAGASDKYVVGSALSAGSLGINQPGLRSVVADNAAITVGGSYAANMAFHRMAIHLLARVPAMPDGGDSADDVLLVTDPVSGLTFQVCLYRQRRRIAYEISMAWGVKAVKTEDIALLLG